MIEQETLLSALRTVKDPELNVNVVDWAGLLDPGPRRPGGRRDDADVAGLPGGPRDPPRRRDGPGDRPGRRQGQCQARDVPPLVSRRMTDAARDELGFF